MTSWMAKRWKQLLIIGAAFCVLGVVTFASVLDAVSMPTANESSCSGSAIRANEVGSAGPGRGRLSAKLQEGQREEVDFGRSIAAKDLKIYLDLSGLPRGRRYFAVQTSQFIRADDATLNQGFIVTDAVSDGYVLVLNLCIIRERGHISIGDPGSYMGSVTLVDSRLKSAVTVPITVTMQYVHGTLLFWTTFLLTLIPGTWCLWVIKTNRKGEENALSKQILPWLMKVQGAVSVAIASTAAIGAYIATYLRDPTWGSSALQLLGLYGAMFTAFVTTGGIAQLAGKE